MYLNYRQFDGQTAKSLYFCFLVKNVCVCIAIPISTISHTLSRFFPFKDNWYKSQWVFKVGLCNVHTYPDRIGSNVIIFALADAEFATPNLFKCQILNHP